MISFLEATDAEVSVVCEAIDTLVLTRPDLIHENPAFNDVIHALMNEVIARRQQRHLNTTS